MEQQNKQQQASFIFVRDDEKSKLGFLRIEDAQAHAKTIPETEDRRVRVRFRNRSGRFDVVVKTRREAKS